VRCGTDFAIDSRLNVDAGHNGGVTVKVRRVATCWFAARIEPRVIRRPLRR